MRSTVLYLLFTIALFRLVCLILGCFYGPYVYLVAPLGGLYLLLDIVTAYLIYANADPDLLEAPSDNDRAFRIAWIAVNFLGSIGLIVAIGLFLNIGFWSMSYEPIHLSLFVLISCLFILILLNAILLIMSLSRGKKSANKPGYQGLPY